MSDALAALAFGITLEQLAYLEEEHNEYGLRELGFHTGQEANAKGADSSYRHKEMLVEHIPVQNAFQGFFKSVVARHKIRDHIHQKQLPGSQIAAFFNYYGSDQKYGRRGNQRNLLFQAMLVFVMMNLASAIMIVTRHNDYYLYSR